MFDGTGSTMIPAATAAPLVRSPLAASVVSAAVPLVALALGFAVLGRMRGAGLSFGLAICISILVSPISRGHYLVLASIPIVEVASHLRRLRFPRWVTMGAILVAVMLLISNQVWKTLAMLLFGEPPAGSTGLPFLVALAAGGPAVAVVGLALLVASIGLADGWTGSVQPEVVSHLARSAEARYPE